jgi:hypothetical protein
MLCSSIVYANPTKNDLDFAFSGDVKSTEIILLADNQMDEIRGKGWFKKRLSWKRARRYAKKHYTIKKVRKDFGKNMFTYASMIPGPTGIAIAALDGLSRGYQKGGLLGGIRGALIYSGKTWASQTYVSPYVNPYLPF